MDKRWKIVLLLLGIFATGAATGALVAARLVKEKVSRSRSLPVEQWAPERIRRLTERLELTPEQQEQLRPIIRRDFEELSRLRGEFAQDSQRIVQQMEREIASHLTPAQQAEYEQVKRETAERFRRMMQERVRSGKGRPDGPGDGPYRRPQGPAGEPASPPKRPPGDG